MSKNQSDYDNKAEELINNADQNDLKELIETCDSAALVNLMLEHDVISAKDVIRQLDPEFGDILDELEDAKRKTQKAEDRLAKIAAQINTLFTINNMNLQERYMVTVNEAEVLRKLSQVTP